MGEPVMSRDREKEPQLEGRSDIERDLADVVGNTTRRESKIVALMEQLSSMEGPAYVTVQSYPACNTD